MQVGSVIGGRYELVELVGRGWSGSLYHARDRETGRQVGLRVLDGELATGPEAVGRFLEPGRAARELGSPHAASTLATGQNEDGALYMVTAKVAGAPLTDLLAEQGALEPRAALEVARQVALGLEAAHAAGLVHLYLSPDDVLVERSPAGELHAQVLGFGVALLFDPGGDEESSITHGGAILGVPAYMSPEQARGEEWAGPTTDLYSLGVVLYEMIAGRPPFEADSAFAVLVHHLGSPMPSFAEHTAGLVVPEPVEALVARLLDKAPLARPASARGLVEAIDALLG